MKKLIFVMASVLFLTLVPTMSNASHTQNDPSCIPIETAKSNVAEWDKNAVWEYLKDGYKFDALMAWAKARGTVPASVDGIVVAYVTNVVNGAKMVMWAISPDGRCVKGNSYQAMLRNTFDTIVGKGV